MKHPGYSGTTLAKKLGIKPGFLVRIVNGPSDYLSLFSDFPDNVHVSGKDEGPTDLIHCFYIKRTDLEKQLPKLREEIKPNGSIWISWYKKSSGIQTDITEDGLDLNS